MKTTTKFVVWLAFSAMALRLSPASGQVKTSDHTVAMDNDVVRKVFGFSRHKAGPIVVRSLFDKVAGQELLRTDHSVPWFEMVVNHSLITSSDPFWQFEGLSQRKMANAGTEYTLRFRGVAGPVKGLLVWVKQQLFPRSTLIREQLALGLDQGSKGSFALNKYENRLHFVFPRYSYQAKGAPVKTKEIRIATWDGEILDSLNNSSYDIRHMDYGLDYGGDHNLSQAHIYHPRVISGRLGVNSVRSFKGPIVLLSNSRYTFLTSYEHASQDNFIQSQADQFPAFSPPMLDFLHIRQHHTSRSICSAVEIVRGGYLDGERITASQPYETVWVATGFYANKAPDQPQRLLHNYLLKWITEFPHTRETAFYYNTWAWQVAARKKGVDPKDVLNYERVFKEIRSAHQLGVKIFVLDAGWEAGVGVWTPDSGRFPKGLGPIYDTLKHYDMTLGLWMSPQITGTHTARYRHHPEWVIPTEGIPRNRQGKTRYFDFVSGYADLFIADCKRLIDQGVRFFKWDDIGTYFSTCVHGLHGDAQDPQADVVARYGYLLPLYIKKAMIALMEYNPDVVVEIDLTENARALMGLSTISAGKLFFMNNGASDYGDHSPYRAKSSRTIAQVYNDIVPLQLFTYANYPQNSLPFMAQRYNVNSAVVAGRGFWGDLSQMRPEQRVRVGQLVDKVARVAPFLQDARTAIIGRVGASPEIYTTMNAQEAAGQVIAFSGSAGNYSHHLYLNKDNFLAVLNNAYALVKDSLQLFFQFPTPDASREAFIVPNQHSGIHILSSTSWLKDVQLKNGRLEIHSGAAGIIQISWPAELGYPDIEGAGKDTKIVQGEKAYQIEVKVSNATDTLIIHSS